MSKIKVLDPTKDTVNDIGKELDTWAPAVAEGLTPGIVSKRYTQSDIDSLKSKFQTAANAAGGKDNPAKPVDVTDLSYKGANYRDARYSLLGRKALRVASLNDKMRAVYGRAVILKAIEDAKKKDK